MENRYFTPEMLDVIANPERWLLVGSGFTPDISPIEHPRHAAWVAANSHTYAHRVIRMTLSGEGWQGFRGQVYPRRPGHIFYFDAFEPESNCSPPWAPEETYLWIALLPSQAIMSISVTHAPTYISRRRWRLIFSNDQLGFTNQAFLAADPSLILPESMRRLHLRSLLGVCLCLAVHAGYTQEPPQIQGTAQQQIVQVMQQHIEETAGRGVTVENLAQLAGYSKYHLLRMFKHYTGRSVHQYINECRVRRIDDMLLRGCNQKEIAAALGFSSPSAYLHWQKGYRKRTEAESE